MPLPIEISRVADLDLEDIFDYTVAQYGVDRAIKYVSSFDEVFDYLSLHPTLGRDRPEIRTGLRSLNKEYHIIFYRILVDRIRIVRILHGSRDLPRHFPD